MSKNENSLTGDFFGLGKGMREKGERGMSQSARRSMA